MEELNVKDIERFIRRELAFSLRMAENFQFDQTIFGIFENQFYVYMSLLLAIINEDIQGSLGLEDEYDGEVVLAPISYFLDKEEQEKV